MNGPHVETSQPPNAGPLANSLDGQMNMPNISQNLAGEKK